MSTNLARSFNAIPALKGTVSVKTGSGVGYPEIGCQDNKNEISDIPFNQKARALLKDTLSTSPLKNFENKEFSEIAGHLAQIVNKIEKNPSIPLTSVHMFLESQIQHQNAPSTSPTQSVEPSMRKAIASGPRNGPKTK